MENPFSVQYAEATDLELIESVREGSRTALETLVRRHQDYIYNIALKMVLSPFDAEDITQEVLLKMITKLGQFQGRSSFRTWLYRITFHHFLKMKRYWLEEEITSFEAYGSQLEQIENTDLSEAEKLEQREFIKEAKLSCLSGMLLCLSREQRLVYILGEIFEADHNIGSELLGISKANFRKKLERARKDLYQFMNRKCGLINQQNPCRCARKTRGFIQAGWVDESKMKFHTDYLHDITATLPQRNRKLEALIREDYAALFQATPFQQKPHQERLFRSIFDNPKVRDIFNLS